MFLSDEYNLFSSKIPSKFFFHRELRYGLHDFVIVWSEVFEFYQSLYRCLTFAECYLRFSEESEYLRIVRPILLIATCICIEFFLVSELMDEVRHDVECSL